MFHWCHSLVSQWAFALELSELDCVINSLRINSWRNLLLEAINLCSIVGTTSLRKTRNRNLLFKKRSLGNHYAKCAAKRLFRKRPQSWPPTFKCKMSSSQRTEPWKGDKNVLALGKKEEKMYSEFAYDALPQFQICLVLRAQLWGVA